MIDTVFTHIDESHEEVEFMIKVSIVEIYNEKIRDLLDISK
jgi:kinesin family protein 5